MVSELSPPSSTLWPACRFDLLDFQSLRTHSRHLVARDSREIVPVHPIVEHNLREQSVYEKNFNVRQRLLECPSARI